MERNFHSIQQTLLSTLFISVDLSLNCSVSLTRAEVYKYKMGKVC